MCDRLSGNLRASVGQEGCNALLARALGGHGAESSVAESHVPAKWRRGAPGRCGGESRCARHHRGHGRDRGAPGGAPRDSHWAHRRGHGHTSHRSHRSHGHESAAERKRHDGITRWRHSQHRNGLTAIDTGLRDGVCEYSFNRDAEPSTGRPDPGAARPDRGARGSAARDHRASPAWCAPRTGRRAQRRGGRAEARSTWPTPVASSRCRSTRTRRATRSGDCRCRVRERGALSTCSSRMARRTVSRSRTPIQPSIHWLDGSRTRRTVARRRTEKRICAFSARSVLEPSSSCPSSLAPGFRARSRSSAKRGTSRFPPTRSALATDVAARCAMALDHARHAIARRTHCVWPPNWPINRRVSSSAT